MGSRSQVYSKILSQDINYEINQKVIGWHLQSCNGTQFLNLLFNIGFNFKSNNRKFIKNNINEAISYDENYLKFFLSKINKEELYTDIRKLTNNFIEGSNDYGQLFLDFSGEKIKYGFITPYNNKYSKEYENRNLFELSDIKKYLKMEGSFYIEILSEYIMEIIEKRNYFLNTKSDKLETKSLLEYLIETNEENKDSRLIEFKKYFFQYFKFTDFYELKNNYDKMIDEYFFKEGKEINNYEYCNYLLEQIGEENQEYVDEVKGFELFLKNYFFSKNEILTKINFIENFNKFEVMNENDFIEFNLNCFLISKNGKILNNNKNIKNILTNMLENIYSIGSTISPKYSDENRNNKLDEYIKNNILELPIYSLEMDSEIKTKKVEISSYLSKNEIKLLKLKEEQRKLEEEIEDTKNNIFFEKPKKTRNSIK